MQIEVTQGSNFSRARARRWNEHAGRRVLKKPPACVCFPVLRSGSQNRAGGAREVPVWLYWLLGTVSEHIQATHSSRWNYRRPTTHNPTKQRGRAGVRLGHAVCCVLLVRG